MEAEMSMPEDLPLAPAPVSWPGLMAEAKSSRAASEVRISMASLMPASSSLRRESRRFHSSLFVWQAALVLSKNSMSAAFCAWVSSYMLWVSARRDSASAFWEVFSAMDFSAAIFSSVLTAMKSSKSRFCLASVAVPDSMLAAKVSYMSLSMPWTVSDCGAYLELPAEPRNSWSMAAWSALRPTRDGTFCMKSFTACVPLV
mmetsp:Transcript_51817/g.113117  ORF Transcript_51817/g.113117 Transcript_51817/m.113117 type:complete len:201 (-) Transcript_51817:538-1140(-)